MKFYTIYKITSLIDGRIYIGQHITSNLNDDYMGSGVHICRAYKKYGKKQFCKTILHVFDNIEEMYAKEAELVTEEFCLREDTFNICLGGRSGGYFASTSEKRKEWSLKGSLSAAQKRIGQKDPEHIRKKRGDSLSKATRGVPKPWLMRKYMIDGKLYIGRKKVLAETGVSVPTIISRIKSEKWDWHYV